MKIYSYTAFYVAEPFNSSSLAAFATPDFNYYQMLKAWKAKDENFPFLNAHSTTYNVRDSSDWESTLKPRLRERLRNSKNLILFLSRNTKNSRALREEVDYAINTLGLPIIVVFPEYDSYEKILYKNNFRPNITALFDNLPIFRDHRSKVPVVYVPMDKELIAKALSNPNYTIQNATSVGSYKVS
ncbi:TIR domain-containing protein [Acinetobacter faecalis]|uniref:TIR domain-containing protein n=1 Tax=Acinetobacter faecalis TaxID=2665161 RepID=A0AB35UTL3_9GAMM|nr:TIR domain-containing protein [Acinetobacter faecalis]MDY6487121.1 TIR domain-containing protein [Acinetobacter faecalis]